MRGQLRVNGEEKAGDGRKERRQKSQTGQDRGEWREERGERGACKRDSRREEKMRGARAIWFWFGGSGCGYVACSQHVDVMCARVFR